MKSRSKTAQGGRKKNVILSTQLGTHPRLAIAVPMGEAARAGIGDEKQHVKPRYVDFVNNSGSDLASTRLFAVRRKNGNEFPSHVLFSSPFPKG